MYHAVADSSHPCDVAYKAGVSPTALDRKGRLRREVTLRCRSAVTLTSSSRSEDSLVLTSRRPTYLLGTPDANRCCGIVLEMYCAASPPLVSRGRDLVAALLQCAPDVSHTLRTALAWSHHVFCQRARSVSLTSR